jgi:DNA-binding MarR family transcriptional regulator
LPPWDLGGRNQKDARRAIRVNSATCSQVVRVILAGGYIEREANARRTFRLALTDRGHKAAAELFADDDEVDLPWRPDTAGHRFGAMIARLGLQDAKGRRYTRHSLRHFRTTHLYNRSKDWVQVAKYLGHTSPAITVELYANNVVEDAQAVLAREAVRF